VLGTQEAGVLQGKLNGGGPNLVLRSSSGDILLKASSGPVATLELESPAK
jgi:hypothetical protein